MGRPSSGATLEQQRQGYEDTAAHWGSPVPGTAIETLDIAGLAAEKVTPPGADRDRALLWFFGGGYTVGSPATERALASRIAASGGMWALLPAYRRCPEHPMQANLDDALAAYRWLVADLGSAAHIVVGGVSAGGGLALRLLCALRDAGDRLPAAGAVISAATDLAMTAPSLKTNARSEAIFHPSFFEQYPGNLTGVDDPRDPRVSPLYAELSGLPPLLIHTAGAEALRDDSVRFAEKARLAGVDVTLHVFPGLWHTFHEQAYVPEARRAVNEVAAFLRDHLAQRSAPTT